MPSSSIFDRLAHQGTAASKAREAEEKKLREEIEQRHAADVAIKALHVKIPSSPQGAGDSTTTTIKSPKLTPQQQAAFFERLAKQETVSSAAHHHHTNKTVIPNGTENNGNGNGTHKASPRNHHPQQHHYNGKSSEDSQQAVYNRLYKQETAASKAHHHHNHVVATSKGMPPRSVISPRVAATTTTTNTTPSSSSPSLLRRSPPNHHAPIVPISMNLYIRTQHDQKGENKNNNKNSQYHDFSPLEIESNRLRKQIHLHQSGKVSALSLTHDIITELFMMDFQDAPPPPPPQDNTHSTTMMIGSSSGHHHWQIGTAIVEELDDLAITEKAVLHSIGVEGSKQSQQDIKDQSDTIKCFWAEKEAILDNHEIYSVAKAKAIIKICGGSTSSIYVDEYQYTIVRREK